MSTKGAYISVGENIHCTRVRMTNGKFVAIAQDGSAALLFQENGVRRQMPVPAVVIADDEWQNGRVRHVAVAAQHGLYGTVEEKALGACYVAAIAREQEAAGAWFLDVNVDEFSMERVDKIKALRWACQVVQQASKVALSIDSSDPEILEAGLAVCDPAHGKPLVNSVSLERAELIPLIVKVGANVIAGASGVASMPESVAARLENIGRLMEILLSAGVKLGEIYLDPLVYPASVDVKNAAVVLEAIRALRAQYGPEIHFAPGLSNISYGYPKRTIINQVFARLCLDAGCDGGIVDPVHINDRLLASIDYQVESYRLARELLLGNDEYGMNYIQAFREERN